MCWNLPKTKKERIAFEKSIDYYKKEYGDSIKEAEQKGIPLPTDLEILKCYE